MNMKGIQLGEFVRRLRAEKGLTFCCLAEKCGVSPEMLVRIENGECGKPDKELLSALACELNTSYPHLMGLAGWLDGIDESRWFTDPRRVIR